jgi:hypothetical protein
MPIRRIVLTALALSAGVSFAGPAQIESPAARFHERAAQLERPRSLRDAAALHTAEHAREVDRRLGGALLPETRAVQEAQRTVAVLRAYAATGEEKYFAESLRRARHLAAWNPRGASAHARAPGDSRTIAWTLALAYDRLAPRLDAAQKNVILSPLRVRAADLYQDDSLDAEALAALAGIATLLAGDLPEAKAWAQLAAPLAAKFHNPQWSLQ